MGALAGDKLTPLSYAIAMKNSLEKRSEILDLIATGLTRDDACEVAGIHRASLYRWLKNATYATALNQAEIRNKARCITLVQNAGKSSWRAAAWWLEKRYPTEFGKQVKGPINPAILWLETISQQPIENITDRLALKAD